MVLNKDFYASDISRTKQKVLRSEKITVEERKLVKNIKQNDTLITLVGKKKMI